MKRNIASGVVLGLFVIAAGVLALLNGILGWTINIGFWGIMGIIVSAVAIVSIINKGADFGNIFGLFIGAWMFIGNLGWLGKNSFRTFIAVLLIAIGVWIIINATINQRSKVKWTEVDDSGNPTDTDDYIKYSCTFSDTNISNASQSFKGGKVSASFGHLRLDLSNIRIQGEAHIEVDSSFGEVEIIMPRHIPYRTRISPFCGEFQNRAPIENVVEGQPFIEIVGSVSFGSCKLL